MQIQQGAAPEFLDTGRKPVQGARGAVTSPNYLATQAGEQVIRKGGHAVEGAIAVNAVLCVVYPHMAGLGGDLFALVYDQQEKRVQSINGSGRAGENASISWYKDRDYKSIPDRGIEAANTVPGTVDAWEKLHQQHGKLEWKELFEDAIYYAEHGFPVSEKFNRFINEKAEVIEMNEEASSVFFQEGKGLEPGWLMVQKNLAWTLKQIADHGASSFYQGEIADKMIASLEKHDGLLTKEDLKNHVSDWQEPISTTYKKDYEIFEMQPNTQGIGTLMMLNILEKYNLKELGDNSVGYYHLMAEAAKIAFTYRDQWVTDPAFEDVPVKDLLSEAHTEKMLGQINMDKAFPVKDLPELPELDVNKDTTYFAVTDKDGNAVSMIQSIYHEFGSGFMVEDCGFLLQNRGSFFSLDEEHPNKLEPGKRTFHTIIPAMALKNDEPFLLFGTMGGEGQPQSQCALFTRIVEFGYDMQQAIEAPRWLYGRTWGEDSSSLKLESRIPDAVVTALADKGHEIEPALSYSQQMGHAQGIIIRNKIYEAGADPRGDGIALSW
ncbi:gamma-glutamyltransferase [Alkalicoccus daliensis]|uniref:Glutathione hydrolase proenzyme n=1 Tax=Alkalicoccus daliensis TaxID=745820 RepID=A0A1H0E2W8_9BACI|nr:gamma-glutamyltransferase [Alkalicoccus daliensis]SDN76695.1 gamma-glutamyltranspeptidase / glutathione hydrolase [Alkalicoccus daliensis]